MLTSLSITRLRGIREGRIDGFAPLTVLVGPNGCGKSAVLEAMLIGAAADPASATMTAIGHRGELPQGARWLLWQGAQANDPSEVDCRWEGGAIRITAISHSRRLHQDVVDWLEQNKGREPFGQLLLEIPFPGRQTARFWFGIDAKGQCSPVSHDGAELLRADHDARLLDLSHAALVPSLAELYSMASRRGRKKDVLALVAAVVPNLSDMEILTEGSDAVLYLHYGAGTIPVPASLAGEGVKNLLRIAMVLAAQSSGLLLLEEPEAHMHPAALRQSARAIVETVRGGVQIVVSTHSLELIDALLAEHTAAELERLAVFRLRLDGGLLSHSRIGGGDVQLAREAIGDDLR